MTEVQKQKGILKQKEQQDDRLASAFSISSPPSASPGPSPVDVARATFTSICGTSLTYPDLLGGSDALEVKPFSQAPAGDHEDLQLKAGDSVHHGAEASQLSPHSQRHAGEHSLHVGHASEVLHKRPLQSDERFTPPDTQERSIGGAMSVREWSGSSPPALAGAQFGRHGGDTSVKKEGSSAPLDGYNGVILIASEGDEDGGGGEGDGHAHANAVACISDSSDGATQPDDGEAEEAESVPFPPENSNEENTARTLKRPRLVWTPELHKRFVDAVSHLGVKTAVPKTIMQLMNVEGLTRENVASHLQKYRLYLKRMQGLSNEGPTSSDHLFASSPVPANLAAAAGRFHAGMPAHLQDISQVPFGPTHNPASMGRGHFAGIMSSPLPSIDPYSFNVFARPPVHRFMQGDLPDVQVFRQHHSTPLQHLPKQ